MECDRERVRQEGAEIEAMTSLLNDAMRMEWFELRHCFGWEFGS